MRLLELVFYEGKFGAYEGGCGTHESVCMLIVILQSVMCLASPEHP